LRSEKLKKQRRLSNHEGLEKDPVDAVAYIELALLILKEELLSQLY
jgi:hypothetical protein